MTLRNVLLDLSPPVDVALDGHVSCLQADGEIARRLTEVLSDAGWVVCEVEDIPGSCFAERLATARRGALLCVDVAKALRDDVSRQLEATGVEAEDCRVAIRRHEEQLDAVAELRDLIIDELGRGAVPRADAPGRWEGIWIAADRMGLGASATEVRSWLAEAAAGRAPLHPVAAELIAESQGIERLWEAAGSGDFGATEAVARARSVVEGLRAWVAELEERAEHGFDEELIAAIDAAHALRADADDRQDRSGVARADEARLLDLYGFANYPDFQISHSTGRLAEHVSSVLPTIVARLDEATEHLAATMDHSEKAGRIIAADRERLSGRIEEFAGGVALEDLVAAPPAADAMAQQCGELTDQLLAESARLASRLEALGETAGELEVELVTREAEVASAERLLVELDRAGQDLSARRVAEVERLEALLSDESTPGVVLQAKADQLDGDAVWDVIEAAVGQVVVVSPEEIPGRPTLRLGG